MLTHPCVFDDESAAKEKLAEWGGFKENYFDGSFQYLAHSCYVYRFNNLLQASHARFSDHHLSTIPLPTDQMLPPVCLAQIVHVDIVSVSRQVFNNLKEAAKKAINVAELALVEMPSAKRSKVDSENIRSVISDFRMTEAMLTMDDQPGEVAVNRYLTKEIQQTAEKFGLICYTNKRNLGLSEYNSCSKYGGAQPDLVAFATDDFVDNSSADDNFTATIVANESFDRAAVIQQSSDQSLESEFDDQCFIGEGKTSTDIKDPIGQLFAGIDKLLPNRFIQALLKKTALLTKCTVYALYYEPENDKGQVYKVEINIGKETVVYVGQTKLGINDAINRIFAQIKGQS